MYSYRHPSPQSQTNCPTLLIIMVRNAAGVFVALLCCASAQPIIDSLNGLFLPHQGQPQTIQPISRAAVYETGPQYGNPNTGYASSSQRPILYAWFPWMMSNTQQRPTTYEGNNNPIASFFQNPMFPWSNQNRPPSNGQPAAWSPVNLLPWTNNGNNHQQAPGNNPVVSFFQNPAGTLFPWAQHGQGSRPGVVYQTPLAPISSMGPQQQELQQQSAPTSMDQTNIQVIPAGDPQRVQDTASVVVDEGVVHQVPTRDVNGVRRITLHQIPCS